MERHGLGTSYRLSSVLLALDKLDFTGDAFYNKMLELAVHHILRVLKNNARIPIPAAWTLVGVADAHEYLGADEIFVCIKPIDGGKTLYLQGDVLISRSPNIHPGDVRIVRAIGCPPPGSCFEKEPLANTVVFSIIGTLSFLVNRYFFNVYQHRGSSRAQLLWRRVRLVHLFSALD